LDSYKTEEVKKMETKTNEQVVSWQEGTGSQYVKVKGGETKVLFLKNWRLVKSTKEFSDAAGKAEKKEIVEFVAEVTFEDGEPVQKLFVSASNRLKEKLRPKLENANPEVGKLLRITRMGEGAMTAFVVNEEVMKNGRK